jgi:hypothetical protein
MFYVSYLIAQTPIIVVHLDTYLCKSFYLCKICAALSWICAEVQAFLQLA